MTMELYFQNRTGRNETTRQKQIGVKLKQKDQR